MEASPNKTQKRPHLFVGGIKDGRILYVPTDVKTRQYGNNRSYDRLEIYKYQKSPYLYGSVFKLIDSVYCTLERDDSGVTISAGDFVPLEEDR